MSLYSSILVLVVLLIPLGEINDEIQLIRLVDGDIYDSFVGIPIIAWVIPAWITVFSNITNQFKGFVRINHYSLVFGIVTLPFCIMLCEDSMSWKDFSEISKHLMFLWGLNLFFSYSLIEFVSIRISKTSPFAQPIMESDQSTYIQN